MRDEIHQYRHRLFLLLSTLGSFLIIALLTPAHAAQNVTLAWDRNSEPDIAGYRLHSGTASGQYTETTEVGNQTSVTLEVAPDSTYFLVVVAYNTAGLESPSSNEVSFTTGPAQNPPPVVTLTGPGNGVSYAAPATVTATADATDSDGISSVAFYANGTLIGSDVSSPYSVNWQTATAGSYSLTAVATDTLGATTTSNPVTITVTDPAGPVNVASAANGSTALASSSYNVNYGPEGTINHDRRGASWGSGAGWTDATPNAYPDWIEINFNGTQTISEIDVFSVQDNYAAPSDPTHSMTFSLYGLRDFDVQYWTGSAWQTVPGGSIRGNNLVWRQVVFQAVTTSRIRILITQGADGYSRVAEIEAYATAQNSPSVVTLTGPGNGATYVAPATVAATANATDSDGISSVAFYANGTLMGTDASSPYSVNWQNAPAGTYTLTAVATDTLGATTTSNPVTITVTDPVGRVNIAAAANGSTALASSSYNANYGPEGTINHDRRGASWGSGGGWNDATPNAYPDWIEINFSGVQTINEIDVFSVQDNYAAPSDPTPSMTFSLYGLRDFDVQYWTGSAWQTVPGGAIRGNNLVWRQVVFQAVTTSRIRVLITQGVDGYSRVTEIEAYPTAQNSPSVVTLTGPGNGATYVAPATVAATADATDSDGISSVAFYANGTLIGTDASSPYSVNWQNAPAGTYTLTAVATDTLGATTTSNPVTITVTDPAGRVNVASAANGSTALASSSYSANYGPEAAINHDRKTGLWTDATPNAYPDWIEINFNGVQTINEIDVFSVQDNYAAPSDPTPGMTFSLYGLRDFDVQYWTGSAWQTVPGGAIRGNNLVWRQVVFQAVTTSRIRLLITQGADGYSRATEIEAY